MLFVLAGCGAPTRHASANTPVASSELSLNCPVTITPQEQQDVSRQNEPLAATFTLHHYLVHGASLQDLRNDMHRCMPNDEEGTADADTRWYVSWYLGWQQGPRSCVATRAAVHVQIDMYFPRWENPSNPSIEHAWYRVTDGLMTHENGHKQNGLDAGDAVRRELTNLRAPTCDKLLEKARRRSHDVVQSFVKKDADYDKRTHHGATQIHVPASCGASVRNACNPRADL